MIRKTKNGAFITAIYLTKIDCNVCGVIFSSPGRISEQEINKIVRDHAHEKHGGFYNG